MIYVKINNNEIESLNKLKRDYNITVEDDFFLVYPPECWEYNGVELVLKADADTIKAYIEASMNTTQPATKVSPIQFKMLFTSAERVSIQPLKQTDDIIKDWFEILDDPRLTHVDLSLKSTQDGLSYLVALGIITEIRKQEIISNTQI